MKYLSHIAILFLAIACQPKLSDEAQEELDSVYERPKHHSETLTRVFDAHGGYEQWSIMKSLSYRRGDEYTITNLQNRKIRLESPMQTIGFDGTDVWVLPDSADVTRARFYHNLYFYFYAMPFVVGDPGAFYEDMDPREIKGKSYYGIKVSYGANVGDAPDDNYILWYDTATSKMEWLMYTVTYSSGEPSDKFNLIKYDQWAEVDGLLLPTTIQWYEYDGATVGDPIGEATFMDIQVLTTAPVDSLFRMPAGAQIAPMTAR